MTMWFLAVLLAACEAGEDAAVLDQPPVFIVGQDLDAIRGYLESGCCPRPDALTAYLSFFNLRAEAAGYGGIGFDNVGKPLAEEHSWGSGPVDARKTANAFAIRDLAIGLHLIDTTGSGSLDRLIAGEYDVNIDKLVKLFALVEGTVYLRIGYEFDGAWNAAYADPARYVAAFRHIVEAVRSRNAGNVQFVWQASASPLDDVLDGHRENIVRFYPGDEYVDWFAFSWFHHPHAMPSVPVDHRPATPRELADEVLTLARAAAKPVMIAEAAPQGFDLERLARRSISPIWDGGAGTGFTAVSSDEIWRAWYEPLFHLLEDNRDVVRALAYINCDWDAQPMWGPPYAAGYWGDSRLQMNARLAKRFSRAVADWKSGFTR
ncbi:MAG: hypothetical protein F4029_08030 [Gammaproteobacteria bacterium]|nr:hypothetical protein [Gammaproteobacteria bacterium]MYF30978.1 hypothetical protein [Gammaproteobacteria bacterium]MYK46163.1 hypothetical protein [Gammaproteobacteria bacterium]